MRLKITKFLRRTIMMIVLLKTVSLTAKPLYMFIVFCRINRDNFDIHMFLFCFKISYKY